MLIDHNTKAGFEAVAEARAHLLNLGTKELADPTADECPTHGSHVIAPVCYCYHSFVNVRNFQRYAVSP